MPNIKSAKKRVDVIAKKTLRNKSIRTSLKTDIKKFTATVSGGDKVACEVALKNVHGALDSAARKGIIHKNKANRKKSRLAKALNKQAASE